MTGVRPGPVEIQVRLFGRYRCLLPEGCATIRLMEGCHLSDLVRELEHLVIWPGPKPLRDAVTEETVRVLINGRYVRAGDNQELNSGDVVALVSPVAGG